MDIENLSNELGLIKAELQLQKAVNEDQAKQFETLIQKNKKSDRNTRTLLYGFVLGLTLMLYSQQLKEDDRAAFLNTLTTKGFDLAALIISGGTVAAIGLREKDS